MQSYKHNTQRYSVNVRTGNWQEEISLKSEIIELYLAQRDQSESHVNQAHQTNASLLRPLVLKVGDDFLRYGEDTQLVCPDIRFKGIYASGTMASLSCSANEREGVLGWAVTASPLVEPTESGCEDGKPLKFGDTFTISLCVSSKRLFVAADVPSLEAKRGRSGHPALKLVDVPKADCRWTVTYWNPALQIEAEGVSVLKGIPVFLVHKLSNQNVAVETDFPLGTFFGDEYEVSAHSYKDCESRVEGPNNIWQFITGRTDESDTGDNSETQKQQ